MTYKFNSKQEEAVLKYYLLYQQPVPGLKINKEIVDNKEVHNITTYSEKIEIPYWLIAEEVGISIGAVQRIIDTYKIQKSKPL